MQDTKQFELKPINGSLALFSRGQLVDVQNPTEYVNTTLLNLGVNLKELNDLRAMAQLLCQEYDAEGICERKSIRISQPLLLLTFAKFKELEAFVNSLVSPKLKQY